MSYEWKFSPKDGGLGCRSGDTYKSESQAIWHGKRWMKEADRHGTISAIKADEKQPIYILDI